MASKNVERRTAPRKPPTVVGAFPSKLLHECPRCGRLVFHCRMAGRSGPVDVETLESRRGNVALQTQIGTDEITAIVVDAPPTWWRIHAPHCHVPAFSRRPGSGKVRP